MCVDLILIRLDDLLIDWLLLYAHLSVLQLHVYAERAQLLQ